MEVRVTRTMKLVTVRERREDEMIVEYKVLLLVGCEVGG